MPGVRAGRDDVFRLSQPPIGKRRDKGGLGLAQPYPVEEREKEKDDIGEEMMR